MYRDTVVSTAPMRTTSETVALTGSSGGTPATKAPCPLAKMTLVPSTANESVPAWNAAAESTDHEPAVSLNAGIEWTWYWTDSPALNTVSGPTISNVNDVSGSYGLVCRYGSPQATAATSSMARAGAT